ncbi:MAG: hypothetical protein CFE21_10970 [Bacteroidetes bacterium B1(2017)]|nr:MAG: hypothetical protein CFE21_10970 [Bacteroidetes bacterium B1(2017)]
MNKNLPKIGKCLLLIFLLTNPVFNWSLKAQTVAIENNPGNSGNIVVGTMPYNVTESIYLEGEIGASNFILAANPIRSIAYGIKNGNINIASNFKIYMKNVPSSDTTFVGVSSVYSTTGFTLVYSGGYYAPDTGYATINLTTPFVRTSGSNLRIITERFDNVTNSPAPLMYASMGYNVASTPVCSRRYNGTILPVSGTTSLNGSQFRPRIKLSNDLYVSPTNNEYWREPFTTGAGLCNLPTTAPATSISYYFKGANSGIWWGKNVYNTTGTGCPAGNSHVRFKNISGVTDSSELVTPIVNNGIKEFRFYRARASRNYSIWVTNDTSALTTNWTFVAYLKASATTAICTDTSVLINSATAKRLKIKGSPGTDTDIDSVALTNYSVPNNGPVLVTNTAQTITSSSAVLGGTISNAGASAIIERGILYATTVKPTFSNTKISMGSGIGAFSQTISGLAPSATYRFRAFAINSTDTAYGEDSIFTTLPASAIPVISSISPVSAKPGDTVTITGNYFNATPINNIIFFSATRATILTATVTQLKVVVPVGATFGPIIELNTATNLACYSLQNFNPIYSPAKTNITTSDFLPKVDFTTGIAPVSVAIGDLDRDGKPDLAIANQNSNTVSILRNTATSGSIVTGSFAPKVDFSTSNLSTPGTITIADIDGDGKSDLVVASQTFNKFIVLRNTSTNGAIDSSSFAPKVDFFTAGSMSPAASIADMDGDGKLDVVTVNASGNSISLMRNTSTVGTINVSSFAPKVDFATGTSPTAIDIADYDGDGKPDVAIINKSLGILSVFRNLATPGSFNSGSLASKVDFTTASNPIVVASGDFDGDGKIDLVVVNQGSASFSIFKNTASSGTIGLGSFASKVDFTTGTTPYSASIGDFDGDSKPDLAIVNQGNTNISVFRNTASTGTITSSSFAAKVDFATTSQPRTSAVGDLDGDGRADMLATNLTNGTLSIFRNASPISTVPILTTSSVTSIAISSATLGGTISSDGGAIVSERGVVYGTSLNPTTSSNTKVQIGSGTGSYSQSVTGLTASTLYHVRAYAINSVGTSYGADSTFTTLAAPAITPSVTTAKTLSIGITSATMGGTASDSGTANITERGVVYGTSLNPTTSSNTKVQIGSGLGTFSQAITGLTASTLYHVRAYAINSVGTRYGADSTFTTLAPPAFAPSVTTAKTLSIGITSATMGGAVSDTGTAAVSERGVVYATSINPTIANTKVQIGSGLGTYSQPITGLTASTLYHVRAYAINSVGTSYGADSTFTTSAAPTIAPSVITAKTLSIGITSATMGGNVSDTGTAAVTERGIVYAVTANPTTSSSTKVQIGTGLGAYSQAITGLTGSTTYHVRAYAINSVGTSYGADSTFTTAASPTIAPSVTTAKTLSIGITSATLGGTVNDTGTAAVSERGVVYATTVNPTTSTNTKVQIGTGLGAYSQAISGLTGSTTYHVRAYAINSVGTSYGADSTFTTLASPTVAPSVTTAKALSIGLTSATLGGTVLDSGTALVSERGIVYATSSNPTTANSKVSMGLGLGAFSQSVTGLSSSTSYHVRAYAINSVGTSYGADSTFTTLSPSIAPSVITASATLVGTTSAALGGTVSDSGTATVSERGIVYATTLNPTTANTKVIIGLGVGTYSQNVTGLTASTLYHVRAYAINSVGTSYGSDSIFTTSALPTLAPTVVTSSATLITSTSATLGGNVTSAGTAIVTERGVVYATTSNPTTANNKVIIGSGTGTYSQNITGLTASTLYHVRAYAINSVGTSYGADSTFTTSPAATFAPTVVTATASLITINSASLGGDVSSAGTTSVTERGVVYATSTNPTTANTKVVIGSGTGVFSQNISGLSAATLYHVRAYAINSIGTSYGADSTFTTATPSIAPTVLTSSPTLLGVSNATLGGNVTDSGTAIVSERGVVYASSANPTTANTKVQIGVGKGAFSQEITGLTAATTYHIRAYAINSVGTSYGADSTFTTTTAPTFAPTVSTATATFIGITSVTLGGNVTNAGTAAVTERGIVYSISSNPTTANTKVQIGIGTGSFTQAVTGLLPLTSYHVRAYAINSVGTSYGADSVFTTLAAPTLAPTVLTSSATSIGITSATLGGNVTNAGTATVTERGIVYGTAINPTTANTKIQIGSGTGVFSQNITGLIAATIYHVRAYAINSVGISYGGDSIFTTSAAPTSAPTVSTSSATSIGITSATLGGNVTNAGTSTVTERGIVYGTAINPTTANTKIQIGSGTGVFSQNITGLTAATIYHIRAYGINSVGISYGGDSVFTTSTAPTIAPTVLTSSVTSIGITSATFGGNVTDAGTATVTERGIVYGTAINPTTANSKVVIGSGTGSYTQNITGLISSTIYHVRAYAINSVGISYGGDSTFTTLTAPSFAPNVSTATPSLIGITNATLGGSIIDSGTATVVERGIVYDTLINPTTSTNKVIMGIGNGSFSQLVSSLSGNTLYHVRAYAINSVGITYGADNTFTTEPYPIGNNTINSSQTICYGVMPLGISGTNPTGGAFPYTYSWISSETSASTGFASASGSNTNSSYQPSMVLQNTWFRRIVRSGTLFDTSNSILIIVNALPEVPEITTKSASQVCLNTMYQNFGSAIVPPATINYAWTALNANVYAQGNDRQYSLISFQTTGLSTVFLTATDLATGCISKDSFQVTVSADVSHEPIVQLFDNNFICKLNNVVAYQWGYDEKLSLKGNKLEGQINQNYYNASPDLSNKYYWVASVKGSCLQKTYYNKAVGLQNAISNSNGLNLYPNPASDKLIIEFLGEVKGKFTIQIIDMMGNEKQVESTNLRENTLDVSDLSNGLYMLNCYQNGARVASKLFVKAN